MAMVPNRVDTFSAVVSVPGHWLNHRLKFKHFCYTLNQDVLAMVCSAMSNLHRVWKHWQCQETTSTVLAMRSCELNKQTHNAEIWGTRTMATIWASRNIWTMYGYHSETNFVFLHVSPCFSIPWLTSMALHISMSLPKSARKGPWVHGIGLHSWMFDVSCC